MTVLETGERSELVELARSVSPAVLAVEPPPLGPELAALAATSLPRRPRAVLFDVYGTLLVSAAGGEPNLSGTGVAEGGDTASRALAAELDALGYSGGSAAFHTSLADLIVEVRTPLLARSPSPEIDVASLATRLLPGTPARRVRRVALLHEAAYNPCSPMPGARELLRALSGASVPLGLVSNAQFYTPLLLEALLGAPCEDWGLDPELTVFSFAQGVAKPDPAVFATALTALARAGIAPRETLFVGNSGANDIAPAVALGLMSALFAGDSRSFRPARPGTPGSKPDIVLTHLEDLRTLFGSLSTG